jgi:ATP-binding cassette subfamily F protein 3
MIQLSRISKFFNGEPLLEDIQLEIRPNSRLGLVGRNGCGKSTLLKIIQGILDVESGTISRSPGLRINYLSQEPQLNPGATLREELQSVYASLSLLQDEEAQLLKQLEQASPEAQEALLVDLLSVQERIRLFEPQTLDARIDRLLQELGFSAADFERKTSDFSGGWRMRINLAKILLEGADILLMDEPTNHLDLPAVEWLEGFLKNYPGGIVLVSHDRRFLDEVCTEIAEIELGRLTVWTGNYSTFLTQKEEALARNLAAYERQQKEIARQAAFVDRFRASATRSTQAKSREKQLAKIERIEVQETDQSRMRVKFPPPQPSGREVLSLQKLKKSFGEKVLFENLNVDLERNQRVFLLGANGCGKTTLFRLALGLENADSGKIHLGHNVRLGYFSQNQLETLDGNLTPFETIHNAAPQLTNTEVRNLLARFLFTGDEVFKPVHVLSGGEKSKLALARLMLSGPNTLLLDEPTNHMDIPAKEVLAEALKEFEGTILCISHDRYFIQQLATQIWEIHDKRLISYVGDYEYYLFKRPEMHARLASESARIKPSIQPPQVTPAQEKSGRGKSPLQQRKELEKQLAKSEKEIIRLEEELAQLEAELENPSIQHDFQKLQALSESIEQQKQALDVANQQWETLSEQLLAQTL